MKIVADEQIAYLNAYFGKPDQLILLPGRLITSEQVKDADLLLVRSITTVDKQLLAGSTVRAVASVTAGHDHLDTDWLDQQNIFWCIAKGFNAHAVAHYVQLVLQTLNQFSVPFSKVAIIGVGHVGRLVAEQLRWLGCEVLLCDPLRAMHEPDFIHHSLETIQAVDCVTLHVPLTRGGTYPTYHLINEHFLKRQKPDCVLINTSRGAVIDTQALLTQGRHLKWCFDVWDNEPDINLAVLDEAAIASPHIAGYAADSRWQGITSVYYTLLTNRLISERCVTLPTIPQTIAPLDLLQMTQRMKHVLQTAADKPSAFDALRYEWQLWRG